MEKDDVKQEILTHAYAKRSIIEEHRDSEPFLWDFFKRAGIKYASKERDARDLEDGQYSYTPREARIALASFLYTDEELSERLGRQDDVLQCCVTDNIMSARMDASLALNRLPRASRDLLTRRYVQGLPLANDTERKAANRAVDALARQMNRDLRR
ncbi:hypothetical protein [Streptomyces buecherae]|uniref:hypothetical protein n=1 Tax=Streptomyces buecherae TaxID=2763006 RepID=UPI00379616E6